MLLLMNFTKVKKDERSIRHSKKDIQKYTRLCYDNLNIINKYEKLYCEYFDDFNFNPVSESVSDSTKPPNNNKVQENFDNFDDDDIIKNINNKCTHNLSIIYNDFKDLSDKINYRINDAKLDINSNKTKSDPIIKSLINKAEPKLKYRFEKLNKNLDEIFDLFHVDYNNVGNLININEYSKLITPSDDIEFEKMLKKKGIRIDKTKPDTKYKTKSDKNIIENFGIFSAAKKISNTVKSVGNIVKSIFTMMRRVFNFFISTLRKIKNTAIFIFTTIKKTIQKVYSFIRHTLIPGIRKYVQFVWKILSYIPAILKKYVTIQLKVWCMTLRVFLNFIRCPAIPIIIFIILFIGMQKYVEFLIDLSSVPPVVYLVISLVLTIHQIYFNGDNFYLLQNSIIQSIVPLFRSKNSKKTNLKDDIKFVTTVLIPRIVKYLPHIIAIFIVSTIIIKIYINKYTEKIISYF